MAVDSHHECDVRLVEGGLGAERTGYRTGLFSVRPLTQGEVWTLQAGGSQVLHRHV